AIRAQDAGSRRAMPGAFRKAACQKHPFSGRRERPFKVYAGATRSSLSGDHIMIERRPFEKLGGGDHGWLNTRHHFSFADYRDPQRMGWGALRVWNDDEIAPQSGFPPHPHADMEIVTYVRQGTITHQDSLGNKGRTKAGDVQVMSAGTGIRHSEYNLETEPTTIFQLWIVPSSRGDKPGWDTRPFPKGYRSGHFVTLASGFD